MAEEKIKLKTAKFPDTELALGKVTVFLGANGTGKSMLMKDFKNNGDGYFSGRDIVYVEGGRTISIPSTVALDRNNYNSHKTVEQSRLTHSGMRKGTLAKRVTEALILLDKEGDELGIKHSDAVSKWQENGSVGECPKRPRPPLDLLFDQFHTIFPSIKLGFQAGSKNFFCKKNGGPEYSPNELSDGEKQVLSILADIAHTADINSLIIVDEPELNLNAGLACRLWETIEAELEGAIFIYATHDIGFATRPNVDGLYALGKEEDYIAEIGDISEIDEKELPSLLGNIPAILSYSSVLIVEGKDDSFDFPFYSWILTETETGIVPVESSNDVKAITKRASVWDKIALGIKLRGVIDRDYKSDANINNLTGDVCMPLRYHEAESYFCHPDLVHVLSSKLGISELSKSDVKNIILDEFSKSILEIATKRVETQTNIRLCVSIEKQVLARIDNKAKIEEVFCKKAEIEMEKASMIGPDKIKKILKKEFALCEKALSDEDIEKILELMPSKQLLEIIASKIGIKNKLDFLKAVKKHLRVSEFPHLLDLTNQLKALFEAEELDVVQEKRQERLKMQKEEIVVGLQPDTKTMKSELSS